jgi:CheY-like chemotaxis protein
MNASNPRDPILIVDDEEQTLKSVDAVLKMNGMGNTVLCNDSRTVVSQLEHFRFSAVLLDLSMPAMSGVELLTMIGEQYPETPVIVATAQNSFQTAVQCMKLGAFDYLVKPVNKDALLLSVRRAIGFGQVKRENAVFRELLLSESQGSSLQFLFKAREECKSLFETMLTPSFVADVSTGQCLYHNRAFSEFVEKYMGDPSGPGCIMSSLREDDRSELLEQCDERGEVAGMEIHGSFGGAEYTIIISCRLLSEEAILQGNFLDVTEQRRLEDRDRKTRHVDSLGGVVGSVAHDFRNILTAVSGYAELIELDVAGIDCVEPTAIAQTLADLRQIRMMANRASALTDTLLGGQTGVSPKSKRADVNGIAGESVEQLQPQGSRS